MYVCVCVCGWVCVCVCYIDRLVQAMANHATLHGIHTGAQVAGALLVGDVMGAGLRQVYHALEHGEARTSTLNLLRNPSRAGLDDRRRAAGQRVVPAGWSAEDVRSLGMRGEAASRQRRRVRQVCILSACCACSWVCNRCAMSAV